VLGLGDVRLEESSGEKPAPASPPPFALEVDLKSPFTDATRIEVPQAQAEPVANEGAVTPPPVADTEPDLALLALTAPSASDTATPEASETAPEPSKADRPHTLALHDADSDVSDTPSHEAITQVHPSNAAATTIDDVTRVDLYSPLASAAALAQPEVALDAAPLAGHPSTPPAWFDEPSTIGSVSSLPPTTRRKRRSNFGWGVTLLALGGLALAALFLLDFHEPAERVAASVDAERNAPAASSAAAAVLASVASVLQPTPAATPTSVDPKPTAAPEASHEAAPAASTTEHISPDPRPLPEPPDASKLPEDSAYLLVRSEVDANVFVHGVVMGKTNQWLESRCGFRFLRLGTVPGQWLSEGKPVKLGCRKPNEVELAPYPR
jgi:hypothetical protein